MNRLATRRFLFTGPLAIILGLAAFFALFGSSRATPPTQEIESFEAQILIQYGSDQPIASCAVVEITSFQGMVQRLKIEPCDDDLSEGDLRLDTSAVGWKNLISKPSVFRLQIPSNAAAELYVGGAWRPLSSFPGGYANVVAGLINNDTELDLRASGRVAYVQQSPSKVIQLKISITAHFSTDLPVFAQDDAFTVVKNDPTDVSDPLPVLDNDIDLDGGPKVITSVTQPAHGVVTFDPITGTVIYDPDDDYCTMPGDDPDEFTYTVNNDSTATVRITVECGKSCRVPNDQGTALDLCCPTPGDSTSSLLPPGCCPPPPPDQGFAAGDLNCCLLIDQGGAAGDHESGCCPLIDQGGVASDSGCCLVLDEGGVAGNPGCCAPIDQGGVAGDPGCCPPTDQGVATASLNCCPPYESLGTTSGCFSFNRSPISAAGTVVGAISPLRTR